MPSPLSVDLRERVVAAVARPAIELPRASESAYRVPAAGRSAFTAKAKLQPNRRVATTPGTASR